MAQRLLLIGGLVGLFIMAVGGAAAKMPSYVISGGELGPYAYQFFGFMDNGEPAEVDLAPEWPGSRQVEAPVPRPSLAYDIYPSYGNFAVPYQIANGGPDFRFYPEERLLHARSTDEWYQLAPDVAEFLEGVIRDALAKKDAGELEVGPIAADFRARYLAEGNYRFSAYPRDGLSEADLERPPEPWVSGPAIARIGMPASETFILHHLVGTISRAPKDGSAQPPAVVISYSAWDRETGTGYGGLLGFYTPPANGRLGRFWDEGYLYDKTTPYYETTPGFDQAVAEAVDAHEVAAVRGQPVSDRPLWTVPLVAGLTAVGVGVLLAVGGVLTLAARRRQPRR
jgi:hypothetical protein